MSKRIFVLTVFLILAGAAFAARAEEMPGKTVPASELISGRPQQLPIEGMVTMVDIGAHACIPCKLMTPIIEELSREYEGRAAIAFIDVWQHREEIARYGISAIPTQIFYDAQGTERFRHRGFMDKESIVAKLAELGVK